MAKIIIGIIFIIGGLTGYLVLRGTSSGIALAAVGVGYIIWGFIKIDLSNEKKRSRSGARLPDKKYQRPGTYDY